MLNVFETNQSPTGNYESIIFTDNNDTKQFQLARIDNLTVRYAYVNIDALTYIKTPASYSPYSTISDLLTTHHPMYAWCMKRQMTVYMFASIHQSPQPIPKYLDKLVFYGFWQAPGHWYFGSKAVAKEFVSLFEQGLNFARNYKLPLKWFDGKVYPDYEQWPDNMKMLFKLTYV